MTFAIKSPEIFGGFKIGHLFFNEQNNIQIVIFGVKL